MEWQDDGIVLGARAHGEAAMILDVLTEAHGRHLGVVRGGASRRLKPILQPGSSLRLVWRARLEEHLGAFTVEPLHSRAAILADRTALAGLNALTAMAQSFLPEREAHTGLYAASEALLDRMLGQPDWPPYYVLWEISLLDALGYRLSLGQCAVSGAREGLRYVSPKSGAAVTEEAGREWADRLLPLPPFLRSEHTDLPITKGDLRDGLALTGHFLRNWLTPAAGKEGLPPARERLSAALARLS